MIINKNTVSKVAISLQEKVTLVNPYFLFEFENEISHKKTYVILLDTSVYTSRYNLFLIAEPGDVSLTSGSYLYTVREQLSSSNLDPALAGAIIEIGRCVVPGAAAAPIEYSKTTEEKIIYGQS